jgi:hypothetical protein
VSIGPNHYVACHNWQTVRADAEAMRSNAAGNGQASAATNSRALAPKEGV